jgi:membrane protease YdiL (CAAX protease family)
MNKTIALLKHHSLVLGIVLMFLLTWPLDLVNSGIVQIELPFVLLLFLGWGFVFASVIMTWLTLGKDGVIALLKRYLQWRVGWKWYLAAFLLEPLLVVLGVYGNAALTGVAPDFSGIMAYKIFGEGAILWLFILPFFLIDFIANGEEIGWRGYVLPRLQAKYSALASSLILGTIWGVWHLLKFLPHWSPVSFALFMLHTLAFAVTQTWLYNNTRGSLLLATIMHASANTVGIFFPMANTVSSENIGAYIGYVLFEMIAASVIVIVTGPARLSRTEAKQIQEDGVPPAKADVSVGFPERVY